jgi:serine/threonine-protein kinase
MGEVYRARDTKLKREVAIKVLPEEFSRDPDRIARFQREAEVLASLNHPNIAAIYDLEEAKNATFLVLELVDGETLADRIARGPIPIDEALQIAKSIAEALEAAHEKGIIHRDLKPANVKITPDGKVKVLDFGLAKIAEAQTATDFSYSPTLMSGSAPGVILGTAAYMSPEQAKGKTADKRADIWAFGVVLYEMLAGKPAFRGETTSDILAAVLKEEPDWSGIPAKAQPLLRRCLNKDPKNRLQAIGDARVELDELLSGVTEPITVTPIAPSGQLWRRAIVVAVIVLITATVTGAIVWFASRVAPSRVLRFAIMAPNEAAVSLNGVSHDVAMTPDGSRLVYVGANGTTLFVRPLDQLEATPLVRGGALRDPFVSPDGQWVGFFDGFFTLKKVGINGGPAELVARLDSAERGATWVADGTIIFATQATTTGLQRVSADGGTPAVLTRPDLARGEAGHLWPEWLPGEQAVLYTVTPPTGRPIETASIAVLDLRHGRMTILLQGGYHAQYVASGHLVYAVAAGTLRAVGFDARRLIVVGPPTTVAPQVRTTLAGAVEAVLARDGTLVYVPRDAGSALSFTSARTLVWVDRQGHETAIAAPPRAYFTPRVSPDGTRVAVGAVVDQNYSIWLWDLARANLTPLTLDPALNALPVWTPDSRRVVFTSNRSGVMNLYSQAADGTGAVERLTESLNIQRVSAVSPDHTVVFTETSPKTGEDVMAVPLDGTHQVTPLVQTTFSERNGIVSPDGRWLAYEADDSGPFQINVRPFPNVESGHWRVSVGTQPLWARGGQELFYVAPDGALMSVAVAGGPAWSAGAPTKVFEGRYVGGTDGPFPRNYDIAADGKRFLMIKASGSDATGAPPQIVVVQHFDQELKQRVSVH